MTWMRLFEYVFISILTIHTETFKREKIRDAIGRITV